MREESRPRGMSQAQSTRKQVPCPGGKGLRTQDVLLSPGLGCQPELGMGRWLWRWKSWCLTGSFLRAGTGPGFLGAGNRLGGPS